MLQRMKSRETKSPKIQNFFTCSFSLRLEEDTKFKSKELADWLTQWLN